MKIERSNINTNIEIKITITPEDMLTADYGANASYKLLADTFLGTAFCPPSQTLLGIATLARMIELGKK